MKRDIYQHLLAWKTSDRRKPLILRGARQVGKTYLLKSFAQAEYANFIYVNFELNKEINGLFQKNLDPHRIIRDLALLLNQQIEPHHTLIIFDEVQECPEALISLKYFYEQAADYHIAAAGSLLGVKLAGNLGFPVGKVNFLDLYPLSFFEFLSALDRESLRTMLLNLQLPDPLSEPIHNQLLDILKLYMFIGGMPETVQLYLEKQDLQIIREVHQEIIDAYVLDFVKHAPPIEVMKITNIWELIPSQLAKENKKFIFSAISKSARAREYETAIQWLTDARLIHKTYHISAPAIPLESYIDRKIFKIFLLDVGLLGALARIPASIILEGNKLFTEFKGSFTENFVAQELAAKYNNTLYYWSSTGTAEVDFVLPYKSQIYPLEVKSGKSKHKKSLISYEQKYSPSILSRTSLMNLLHNGKICNYPLYLVSRFPELCTNCN